MYNNSGEKGTEFGYMAIFEWRKKEGYVMFNLKEIIIFQKKSLYIVVYP